jgi:hypothetical protein
LQFRRIAVRELGVVAKRIGIDAICWAPIGGAAEVGEFLVGAADLKFVGQPSLERLLQHHHELLRWQQRVGDQDLHQR